MIHFIVWLLLGGIAGWLASIIMQRDAEQGVVMNIIVGILGAALAGGIVSPLIGVGTINDGFSLSSFAVSLLGAVLLIWLISLFRRGGATRD